jgi:hypothetical protein
MLMRAELRRTFKSLPISKSMRDRRTLTHLTALKSIIGDTDLFNLGGLTCEDFPQGQRQNTLTNRPDIFRQTDLP